MRSVVVYASCEGQTAAISNRVAAMMSVNGVPADTFDVTREVVTELSIQSYQAVVLGSSLHYGQHDPRIAWVIRQNATFLRKIPTAFFSVSLGIISANEHDRKEARKLAEDFLAGQHFRPSLMECFAGAIQYSKYGWWKKQMMHWIAEKSGKTTLTDRDYDFTDWSAVERFSTEFVQLVQSRIVDTHTH